jgi:hypothetical protein
MAIMANTAIHLSRLQEILTDDSASLRPGDGQRSAMADERCMQ